MTAENQTSFASTNKSGVAAEKPPVILFTAHSRSVLFEVTVQPSCIALAMRL